MEEYRPLDITEKIVNHTRSEVFGECQDTEKIEDIITKYGALSEIETNDRHPEEYDPLIKKAFINTAASSASLSIASVLAMASHAGLYKVSTMMADVGWDIAGAGVAAFFGGIFTISLCAIPFGVKGLLQNASNYFHFREKKIRKIPPDFTDADRITRFYAR